jgi:hypothetical protein
LRPVEKPLPEAHSKDRVRTAPAATPTPPTRRSTCPEVAGSNDLPTAFALGAGFAWLAFKRELALLGSAFSLFAAADLVYMTYRLDWTVFLFAHTIAEVLDLTAFVLVFAAAVYAAVRRAALNTVEVNR